MIDFTDKIVEGPASDLPMLFEAPVFTKNFMLSIWMTAEPIDGIIRVTDIDSGDSIDLLPTDRVTWLQPFDMNDEDERQAIIDALKEKGIDL